MFVGFQSVSDIKQRIFLRILHRKQYYKISSLTERSGENSRCRTLLTDTATYDIYLMGPLLGRGM